MKSCKRWEASMTGRVVCGIAFFVASLAAASPAAARECGPLKQLASTKMLMQGKYRPLLEVSLNGTPKHFLVDTGGGYTSVTPRTANELHLAVQNEATPIYNASGVASQGFTKIDSIEMGGMKTKDVYLRVWPSNIGADGLIAPDVMKNYDVEMDFAGKKMNYFLPDHCPGKVVYWPHTDAAQVSINLVDKAHIRVPVTLDGKSLLAVIDTGATNTVITTKMGEEAFGLKPGSPDMKPAGNLNGDPNLASYTHTFGSLTLDGIGIKNLDIVAVPDRVTENSPKYRYSQYGGTMFIQKRMEAPDIVLGMDVLKHLHLYFAFKEGELYVTSADLPMIDITEEIVSAPQATSRHPMTAAVLAPLAQALAAIKKKDYPAALPAIARAKEVPGLKTYDLVMIHRVAMLAYHGMKDADAVIAEADAVAALPADESINGDRANMYEAAMEDAFQAKQYDKATKFAKLYAASEPAAADQPRIKYISKFGNSEKADAAPAK
jgi:predicted aspartyl protease